MAKNRPKSIERHQKTPISRSLGQVCATWPRISAASASKPPWPRWMPPWRPAACPASCSTSSSPSSPPASAWWKCSTRAENRLENDGKSMENRCGRHENEAFSMLFDPFRTCFRRRSSSSGAKRVRRAEPGILSSRRTMFTAQKHGKRDAGWPFRPPKQLFKA